MSDYKIPAELPVEKKLFRINLDGSLYLSTAIALLDIIYPLNVFLIDFDVMRSNNTHLFIFRVIIVLLLLCFVTHSQNRKDSQLSLPLIQFQQSC